MNAIRLFHLLEFIIFSSETNIDNTARNLVYVQAGKGMVSPWQICYPKHLNFISSSRSF